MDRAQRPDRRRRGGGPARGAGRGHDGGGRGAGAGPGRRGAERGLRPNHPGPQNCIKMPSEWYYFKVYENCIKENYRGISSSDDKSFDPHRFFVSELAWMIDQRNPGMSDLYSTLDEVYKMVNLHSTLTPDATFVLSDTPDPSKTEQARVALAQTESARTQAEQAQIATETAQAQTARAIWGDGNHSVQSAPSVLPG